MLRPSSLFKIGGMVLSVPLKSCLKERLQNIIGMVAQGNFIALQFDSSAVEDAAAQPRAEGAGGFSFRDLAFDNAVGITSIMRYGSPRISRYRGRTFPGKPAVLVQIYRDKLKAEPVRAAEDPAAG